MYNFMQNTPSVRVTKNLIIYKFRVIGQEC